MILVSQYILEADHHPSQPASGAGGQFLVYGFGLGYSFFGKDLQISVEVFFLLNILQIIIHQSPAGNRAGLYILANFFQTIIALQNVINGGWFLLFFFFVLLFGRILKLPDTFAQVAGKDGDTGGTKKKAG
jgi:hypothetical protein